MDKYVFILKNVYFCCTEKQAARSTKCLIHSKNSKNYGKTLTSLARRLECCVADYQCLFRNKTKDNFSKTETFIKGIVQSQLRNIEQISEDTGADYHQLQHFITESKWDAREVINQVASEVSAVLPKRKLTGLYLPKDWRDDSTRCDEAGVLQEHRGFKTKIELAVDIINQQVENGISFDFIGADGYYGNDVDFASTIENPGYLYMVDVHSDQKIFTERPDLIIPERKSNRGRKPTRLKATKEDICVSEYLKTLQKNDWQTLKVRNTTKGKLIGQYHFARVFVWNTGTNEIERRVLVIRKIKSGNKRVEIKYSFTNANPDQYTPEVLAYMQAQRFFVEHSIKESKYILAMDQFQTRKWMAWQHQVALNFMVSSFILKEKIYCFDDLPLLSARDIKEILVYQLYKKMTEEEVISKIFNRHLKRQRDINYSFTKG